MKTKFWKRSDGDEDVAVSQVKKSSRKFRIKVRLYDGHGAGQVRKFNIFVEPKHNVMEDTEEKIKRLFGGRP